MAAMSAEETAIAEVTEVISQMNSGVVDAVSSNDVEVMRQFLLRFNSPDWTMVRPSGNPLNMESLLQMWNSPDVNVTANQLLGVNSVKIFAGGNAAVATFTCYQVFNYKGQPNTDVSVYTSVLEKSDAGWMTVHQHRCSGRAPTEEETKMVN